MSFKLLEPENWTESKKILCIFAHPDDPDFFMGATLARWASAGHQIIYCLLTRGDRGGNDASIDPLWLGQTRELEQRRAARLTGVQQVHFLDLHDGEVLPTMENRKIVTRLIRSFKPDILATNDPTTLYSFGGARLNHPDHRYTGQVVLDAYFPGAGSPMYFPELATEGLSPHSVQEIWLAVTHEPNVTIDVTATWSTKIQALHEHASQIGDPVAFDKRMAERRTPESTPEQPRFEEKFRRLRFE